MRRLKEIRAESLPALEAKLNSPENFVWNLVSIEARDYAIGIETTDRYVAFLSLEKGQ